MALQQQTNIDTRLDPAELNDELNRVAEALGRIDTIKRSLGGIRKSAEQIDKEAHRLTDDVTLALVRLRTLITPGVVTRHAPRRT